MMNYVQKRKVNIMPIRRVYCISRERISRDVRNGIFTETGFSRDRIRKLDFSVNAKMK